jgi:hypothetical protein
MSDVSRRVLVPLELTPAVRLFLLGALVSEARRWRVDGLKPPAELRGFIDWLAEGHDGSKFASPRPVPDPELVSRAAAAQRAGVSMSTISAPSLSVIWRSIASVDDR